MPKTLKKMSNKETDNKKKIPRVRRTKEQIILDKKTDNVNLVEESSTTDEFKLQIIGHSELKLLAAEGVGFTVSVINGDKEVRFGFDTHEEKIIVTVPVPKSGYPNKYMFTITQFTQLLKTAKVEKRD
jgi:hypothetical protein